jgi:hypothetical protein
MSVKIIKKDSNNYQKNIKKLEKSVLKWTKYIKTTDFIRTYISIYLGIIDNEKIDEIT